jgi:glutamate-1-semialdehyde 2,1-aminomutase
MPGGVNSNVRLETASVFFERGLGAWLWDADGRDYVDHALGMGATFLGHAHPLVGEAVARAAERGTVYGAQHRLEVEAAEDLVDAVDWPERVRFGLTGSEAVHAALRVARAVTGRPKVVRFTGHYHGWLDTMLIPLDADSPRPASRGQQLSALGDLEVTTWNDAAALEALLGERNDIAAVIMEPVMLNTGASEPAPGYLELTRQLCSERGIVLVFDEVISGFRLALGGAAERYGVTPDLATYGKAMAGGWPVAALAGSADLMDVLADGAVNHSGTFNGSTIACAAVVATIDLLRREPPYENVERYGREVMSALPTLAEEHDLSIEVNGVPAAFHVRLRGGPTGAVELAAAQKLLARRLHQALAEAGIWTTTRGLWFVSASHGEDELAATLARAAKAFDLLRARTDDVIE